MKININPTSAKITTTKREKDTLRNAWGILFTISKHAEGWLSTRADEATEALHDVMKELYDDTNTEDKPKKNEDKLPY